MKDSRLPSLTLFLLNKCLFPSSCFPGVWFLCTQIFKLGTICSWTLSQDVALICPSLCQLIIKDNFHYLFMLIWILKLILLYWKQRSEMRRKVHSFLGPFFSLSLLILLFFSFLFFLYLLFQAKIKRNIKYWCDGTQGLCSGMQRKLLAATFCLGIIKKPKDWRNMIDSSQD